MNRVMHEWFWISDMLNFWFWVGGVPYFMQYMVVEVMRG